MARRARGGPLRQEPRAFGVALTPIRVSFSIQMQVCYLLPQVQVCFEGVQKPGTNCLSGRHQILYFRAWFRSRKFRRAVLGKAFVATNLGAKISRGDDHFQKQG